MLAIVLRGLATRKLRSALTAIAILLGVTMISGTFVLTDQIDRAFIQIFAEGNAKIAVVIKQVPPFSAGDDAPVYVSTDIVDEVRGVEGVAAAEPFIEAQGFLVVDGVPLESQGGAPSFVFSSLSDQLNPYVAIGGRLPEASGEVAVDEDVATANDLAVGQRVGLATQVGVKDVEIVGIARYGESGSIGVSAVLAPFDDVQSWWELSGKATDIELAAAPGVGDEELRDRVRATLDDPQLEIITGAESAEQDANELNALIGRIIRYALLAFAGVAVLVGAFIIFNTFSITVAQRIREFAMLRTIGASRRQVLLAVIGEAFVIGVVASVIGLLLGLVFALLLNVLFDAVGFGLPRTGLVLTPLTIVVSLSVGIVVTVASAIAPALRATRIAPISALREGAVLPAGRLARLTPLIAVVIALIGLGGLVFGLTGDGGTSQRLGTLAGGAILIFIAVAMLSRYIVRPVVRVLLVPLRLVAGSVGRLAGENAARNPARTAVTAAALMIGIGLVVFVTIFVQGLKESFTGAIDKSLQGDLIITARGFGNPLPTNVLTVVRDTGGIGVASPVGGAAVQVDGDSTRALIGVDTATIGDVYRFDWVDGSEALVAGLGADGALVEETVAEEAGVVPGDRITVASLNGEAAELEVRGTYTDTRLLNGIVVDQAVLEPLLQSNETGLNTIFATLAEGADPDPTQLAVEQALRPYPTVQVQSNAQIKQETESQVNTILVLFYALLALSVVISLFGIVNTLVLSIFERTREIGMLRAVGTTRRQLRAMIRWEAVITSIIGGVLGVLLGIMFGWVVAQGLKSEGIAFVLPIGQILLFLALSVLAGVIAAILPARRAAKLDVLEALQYE